MLEPRLIIIINYSCTKVSWYLHDISCDSSIEVNTSTPIENGYNFITEVIHLDLVRYIW